MRFHAHVDFVLPGVGARTSATIVAAALLMPIVAGGSGCSRRPSSADAAAANGNAIAQLIQRLCDLEGENKARAEGLADADRSAADPKSGPLRLLDLSSHLTAAEQEGLAKLYRQQMESSIAQLRGEIDKHDRYVKDQVAPSWNKLAGEWQRVRETRGGFERDMRKSQQSALALGTENKWFWLSALVAVAVLMGMFFLENRHDLRRWLNGGQARALGLGNLLVAAFVLLCLLTAALFFASDGILVDLLDRSGAVASGSWAAERAEDAQKITEAEARQASQLQEVEQIRKTLLEKAMQLVPGRQATAVVDTWWEHRQLDETRRAQMFALQENQQRFEGMVKELRDDDAAIVADKDATVGWRRYASRISGGIGLGILGLLAAGTFRFERGRRARIRTIAETCPNCLAMGRLEQASDREGLLRCTNVISETPYEECGFEYPTHLREFQKLSFPTLGIPKSGKTFWLAMTYSRLDSRDFAGLSEEVRITPINTSSTPVIEKAVKDILKESLSPKATEAKAGREVPPPPPITYQCADLDTRCGRSEILVNLFDYSGEVVQRMTLDDQQRRRAFNADGYLWFLDPLSDPIAGQSLIEDQVKALSSFERDVRLVKGLLAGQQLHRPIAICVPKIDMMVNEHYAENGNVIERFYIDLGEVGWAFDEQSIDKRSELMRSLSDKIWPNWNIHRAVDGLFGGRYKFFPLTSVGLDKPGERELSRRTIAPKGILHPLMWLLHMNGYPVLPPK
jgi:hypothetical protein